MAFETLKWPCSWSEPQGESVLPRLAGHDSAWLDSLSSGFGHDVYFIRAEEAGQIQGCLPLVFVRGPIFGKFLVSLPYLNTGGIWANSEETARGLVDIACDLADELDVKYLELRHETPITHSKFNHERVDKVHMRLALPESDEILDKSFKSKLRSQIKKSGQYDLQVEFGDNSLLDDFYDVFAVNMRDLGTPVFSKKLFSSIVHHFQGDAEFCVVRKNQQAIAGGMLIHRHGTSEVPSASSLREFNRTNANMLMYRHLLRRAIERGSSVFDFGRSSEGSGTYKFKAQWGALPQPACWQYYVRKGDPQDMRADSEGKQSLVKIWQRLPVWFTRAIGPSIVRGIP